MSPVAPRGSNVEVNETRLYYEQLGDGPPLVLLHADVVDRRMWDDQLTDFSRLYQVIRYDARGFGNSERGIGSYSRAEDLSGLLEALGLGQVILVGCSGGGSVALDFALEHPAATRALVLVSTVPSGYALEGEPPPKLLEFFAAYQAKDLDRAVELATEVWFDGPRRTPDRVDPERRARARGLLRDAIASEAIDLTGGTQGEHTAADRLADVEVPTLVVVGEADDQSILEAGEHLATAIKGAELARVPDAAHLPNLERPFEFNQAIFGFLERRLAAA